MGAALSAALVLSIATRAAPTVAPDTILAFAQYESGLDALAIHDNTTGQSHHPESKREAVALSERLISQGHSIDIGLMQVNAANVPPDVAIAQAFDRNRSIRIGAHLLSEAYGRCGGRRALTTMQKERALRCAAARYNRGSDGPPGQAYAARVWRVAEKLVPSITQLIQAKAGRRSRWSQSHRRHHA
jgi:type IV secretion system protein VirB1